MEYDSYKEEDNVAHNVKECFCDDVALGLATNITRTQGGDTWRVL
jgi:hypothetical protein